MAGHHDARGAGDRARVERLSEGYERARTPIVDGLTSARAGILTNGEGDVIAAFAGTGDLQDAYQNTKLGWEQWERLRDDVLTQVTRVLGNHADATVHFTGHSLGGAHAQ